MKDIRKFPVELAFWIFALAILWNLDSHGSHFSLCPLYQAGVDWCPGCGLGRSVSHLMRGEFAASWEKHPLAAYGLSVILYRIFQLTNQIIKKHKYG